MKNLMMMLTVMALVSCGEKQGAKYAKEITEENKTVSTTVETTKTTPENISLYVALKSDLFACNEGTKAWLVYVKEEETFYACNDQGWEEVVIKGKDGINGSNGVNGKNGTDGEDGTDSVIDASFTNMWKNPVTNITWIFVGVVAAPQAYDNPWGCPAGYSLPDNAADLNTELQSGLLLAIKDMVGVEKPNIWFKRQDQNSTSYYSYNNHTVYGRGADFAEQYVLACKK